MWIACDKDGVIRLFQTKPYRRTGFDGDKYWHTKDMTIIEVPTDWDLGINITWEDDTIEVSLTTNVEKKEVDITKPYVAKILSLPKPFFKEYSYSEHYGDLVVIRPYDYGDDPNKWPEEKRARIIFHSNRNSMTLTEYSIEKIPEYFEPISNDLSLF